MTIVVNAQPLISHLIVIKINHELSTRWCQMPTSQRLHFALSNAKWLSSCRPTPHHSVISSIHSLCGRPVLLTPFIIQTNIFIFLLSFILHVSPNSLSFLRFTIFKIFSTIGFICCFNVYVFCCFYIPMTFSDIFIVIILS